jgi:hypothetical protein
MSNGANQMTSIDFFAAYVAAQMEFLREQESSRRANSGEQESTSEDSDIT